jgi:cytochrome P450
MDLAARMPTAVICEMMGVPRSDWNYMIGLGNRSVGSTDPEYQDQGSAPETARKAQADIFQYFAGLVAQRRGRPGSDLVSVLANGEVEGQRLADHEVLYDCFLLLLGGLETTRNAISGGLLELMRQPEQRAMLLAQPRLITTAIEEILRWTSPIAHILRTATCDTELAGRKIKQGQKIAIWNASANRDEEIYSEPYRFDITRSPNYHLAFGYAEHFCLGANLARLEIKVMVEEVLRRMPDLEVTGEVQRLASCVIAGIKHLPVRFSAGDSARL